ncbi:MAG: hypothetical protein ACP5VP_05090 [Candidatus Limnocylindrales bacterium]
MRASMLSLRPVAGLPEPDLRPPVVAESGDPFAALRIVHLLAQVPRGTPVRVRDIVDELNARWMDWSFDRAVVTNAIVQLQANWMADYRTAEGIRVGSDVYGATVTIEDSSRVDPWMVLQVRQLVQACAERLRTFAHEAGDIP